MRKHMTQAEVLRTERLLRSGVTELAELQKEVFVHAECLERVVTKFNNANAPKKKPRRKAAVDPLS